MVDLKDDLIWGADAAAKYLGLTTRSVYHMVEQGILPHKKMGRRICFRKSELNKTFSSDA